MRSRFLLSAALAGLMTVLAAAPAWASDSDGWVDVDEDDATIDVGAEDRTTNGGGSSGADCTWTRIDPADLPAGSDILPILERDGNQEYDWYVRECPLPDGTVVRDLIPVPREAPPVDPTQLRDRAVSRLELPAPQLAMNPPQEQVVRIESWLWIDDEVWQQHSRSASAGGVTATVTATPVRVVWDLGNGDTVTCAGPGTPYDPALPEAEQTTDCSYTYGHSSAAQPNGTYLVTATVEWEVGWTVTGAAGGGPLPALSTSTTLPVRVAEFQALNE
ncbi:MAG: hypothetical protein KY469_06410 [Actinobacteria bacterium]|nr:hypothetical protein [Actinomycetota bacterium]